MKTIVFSMLLITLVISGCCKKPEPETIIVDQPVYMQCGLPCEVNNQPLYPKFVPVSFDGKHYIVNTHQGMRIFASNIIAIKHCYEENLQKLQVCQRNYNKAKQGDLNVSVWE